MGARVLVVDDHLEMAEMLVESLLDAGFEAEALASGNSALDRLTHNAHHIMIDSGESYRKKLSPGRAAE